MPSILKCLCRNNSTSCDECAERARLQWIAFAARNHMATPGQLIEQAIEENLPEVVLGILKNTDFDCNNICNPQRYGSASPLMIALQTDNPKMVSLISGCPDFDLAQSLPEFESWNWVRSSSLKTLQQYLSIPGNNVNEQNGNGKTLLHEVVYDHSGQDKLTELLSRPGINIDTKQHDGTTPLYRALLAGNDRAFEILLDRGTDVNNRNEDNCWTILICAAAENRIISTARLLLQGDLEVNAVDDIQNTALHIACERGHSHIVELLLQHPQIRVNCKNHMGWTPLGRAAFFGHATVVKLLLERPDIDVNFVDQYRRTPLFHAVSAGNLDIVKLLLADLRTNTAISNRPDRLTAIDMASALGFMDIVKVMEESNGSKDELSANDSYVESGKNTEERSSSNYENVWVKRYKPSTQ